MIKNILNLLMLAGGTFLTFNISHANPIHRGMLESLMNLEPFEIIHDPSTDLGSVFLFNLVGWRLISFTPDDDLARNQRTYTGDKPFSCGQCGKAFGRKSYLTVHRKLHTGIKPYFCNECDKSFARKFTLTVHQRTHSGERPYVCGICDRGFSQKGALKRHARRHTAVGALYSCDKCGKQFAREDSIKRHQKSACRGPTVSLNRKESEFSRSILSLAPEGV